MDPDARAEAEAEAEFMAEAQLAGEGGWAELGLDPPPQEASTSGGFTPQSIDTFLSQ